jgi:uncharacterized protein YdhG (YjbR/CyaY superfamily)
MKKTSTAEEGAKQVDEFMNTLEHPLKVEVNMLREIIKSVNKDITEQIKWKAPSFSYQGQYLVTFNLRPMEHIHLVFHNPLISKVQSPLLEGNYKDRRMAYFTGRDDIREKKLILQKALNDLIKLQKD